MGRLIDANRAQRLLWLNHESYSAPLLTGGRAPWLDSAACVAWARQAHGLLGPDVLTLPLADLAAAWVARDPGLKAGMAEKTRRAHLPLKACLASAQLREYAAELTTALRSALSDAIFALVLPSPRDWAAQALVLAGGPPDAEIDEDAADAAASCMADFLRLFAASGVDAVLLSDSRPWEADEAALSLELLQPVANVARHYGWDWGLRLPATIDFGSAQAPDFVISTMSCDQDAIGLVVPESFWQGDDLPAELPPPTAKTFDVADIPATAQPERVLARLALLRERRLSW